MHELNTVQASGNRFAIGILLQEVGDVKSYVSGLGGERAVAGSFDERLPFVEVDVLRRDFHDGFGRATVEVGEHVARQCFQVGIVGGRLDQSGCYGQICG